MDIVYSSKVRGVGPNEFCWKPTRSRHFEVSNFYLSFYPPTFYFPWRLVWQLKVPPRVAFFSWSTSLVEFLQLITFAKGALLFLIGVTCVRGVRSRWIIFCFITPIAFEMWSLVLCLFGLHWVIPQKVIDLFESWQGKFGQHRNIDFWRLVLHCFMRCIWSERNARCFEGCKRSLLEIKSFFLHSPCLVCGSVTLFLFFLIIVIWFLIFSPIVHPQCTRVGYFFLNKIFCYLSKKKKKD